MTPGRNVPLISALRDYASRDTARFHMPGHKGRMPPPFSELARLDFTELDGTGNLYTEEDGAIRRSEALTASLYGARGCMYLTGGATQGVLAMLAAVTSPGDRVLLDRCCHRSVLNAAALLDLRPVYLQRPIVEPFGISDGLRPEDIPDAKCLLVTSPTYYGVTSELRRLRGLCEEKGMPLLVDGAHGAHLRFLSGDAFVPDIAVHSAHKTLNALGQTAFLLYGPGVDADRLRGFTAVFGTSSPSYPLLCSLDASRAELEQSGRERWEKTADFAARLRKKHSRLLSERHLSSGSLDPARLCLFSPNGYDTALRFEREFGVVCEMADAGNVVFILTPSDSAESLSRLDSALTIVPDIAVTAGGVPPSPLPQAVMTPREAMFARRGYVPLREAGGRIAAQPAAPYPPGVPLVCPGERFDKNHLEILRELWYTDDEPVSVVLE